MKIPPVSQALCLGMLLVFAGCGKNTGTNVSSPTPTSSSKPAAPAPASGRAVEITGNDVMKFSLTEIRARPGEALSVTLTNVGVAPKFSMGHNWVLLKIGTNFETFVLEAASAPTTDYVPASQKAQILAHTKLLGPKESDTVTFNAPMQPGNYPFLCSFPGHFQVGMKGELIVE